MKFYKEDVTTCDMSLILLSQKYGLDNKNSVNLVKYNTNFSIPKIFPSVRHNGYLKTT